MNGHESSERYEAAISRFQNYLHRANDGTFLLQADGKSIIDGNSIGVDDPVIFADLVRSLEETNRKILNGEIDPKLIK